MSQIYAKQNNEAMLEAALFSFLFFLFFFKERESVLLWTNHLQTSMRSVSLRSCRLQKHIHRNEKREKKTVHLRINSSLNMFFLS